MGNKLLCNAVSTQRICKLIDEVVCDKHVGTYSTLLYTDSDIPNIISASGALIMILIKISEINTIDEYNNFHIAWFEKENTNEDDDLTEGDVVVSIYASDELEPDEPLQLQERLSCANDYAIQYYIIMAMQIKYNELIYKENTHEK